MRKTFNLVSFYSHALYRESRLQAICSANALSIYEIKSIFLHTLDFASDSSCCTRIISNFLLEIKNQMKVATLSDDAQPTQV